jgi:tetratricopeptide (TPR) repeat protein
LVSTGAISSDVHERTLARALGENLLHGRVLVEGGLISERALARGLREQLLRQMLWLFARPRTTRFGYFDGSNFLENWGAESSARVSVMELLWRGLRDHFAPDDVRALLGKLGDRPIVLREDMPLDYFFFMGSDRDVVELLRGRPQRLDELLQRAPGHAALIERVVCLLLLSRSMELGRRSAPPLGVEANVEPSPWSLRHGDVPRIPGLFESEPESEQPSVLSTPIPVAEPSVLSTPIPVAEPEIAEQREEPPPSSGESKRYERALAASDAFRRAEALLSHGHIARAEREARTALELEPGQAEHVALCAWIDALKPGADASQITLELKRALRLAENNIKVHWYRGLVLQHLGRHEHALREFRSVLELDPRHLDAARQIRIYEMRLEKSPKGRPSLAPEPESAGGWFRRRS